MLITVTVVLKLLVSLHETRDMQTCIVDDPNTGSGGIIIGS
jgi:hypothetical protein